MEKINFLGIEMDVVSEEEQANAPQGTVYAMMRVVDTEDEPSGDPGLDAWYEIVKARRTRTKCQDCKAVCYLDPLSYGKLPPHTIRVCIPCLMLRSEAEQAAGE